MKKHLAVLVALSLLSGFLTSNISWFGKVGIHLAHRQYHFLRVWWQAALVFFLVQLLFWALLHFIIRRWPKLKSVWAVVFLLLSILVVVLAYHDFRGDFTHRWLGERFHLGIYLYGLAMAITSLRFLKWPQRVSPPNG